LITSKRVKKDLHQEIPLSQAQAEAQLIKNQTKIADKRLRLQSVFMFEIQTKREKYLLRIHLENPTIKSMNSLRKSYQKRRMRDIVLQNTWQALMLKKETIQKKNLSLC